MYPGVKYAINADISSVVTPIKVDVLGSLLRDFDYPKEKIDKLIHGFTYGFDFGYRGPKIRKHRSDNIPLRIGSHLELWNKVMKEVELGRYAGPFSDIPYDNYMQSPVGLVPKGENQTRLIFHLSYDFNEGEGRSFNFYTPKDICSVKYRDLDCAVKDSLFNLRDADPEEIIYYGKTDLKSAFRLVPGRPSQYCWLILKAKDPISGKYMYFVDKCMPFGASISCTLFTDLSNCLRFLVIKKTGIPRSVSNYLDDYLFMALSIMRCNYLLRTFLELCANIGCPVSEEKTEWASVRTVFLGIMLDGEWRILIIPENKRAKALNDLNKMIDSRTVTVKAIEQITGSLNFLNKAIIAGRTFTLRMYAKMEAKTVTKQGKQLKQYHHVKVDQELRCDCMIWKMFLTDENNMALCRPFVDISERTTSKILKFYTDSSASEVKGFGCRFGNRWTRGVWGVEFIRKYRPSIAYLELYALCVGIFTWENHHSLKNARIKIFYDNKSVRDMVNSMTSKCKNCLHLLRLLTLNNLRFN